MPQRRARDKTKELLVYCAAGILVAAAAILSGIYLTPAAVDKWMGFIVMSAFIFGNAIRYSKTFWGLHRFWWAFVLFLGLHCIVGFTILRRFATVRLIDFALIGIVEYFALDAYLRLFLRRNS